LAVCVTCGRLIDDASAACPSCKTERAATKGARDATTSVGSRWLPHRAGRAPACSGAELRSAGGAWDLTVKWVLAAAVAGLLAYMTYTRSGWIPLLSDADLAIHEFGHRLTFWAPTLIFQGAGSFLQVAAPLGLGGYFLWRRDRFAVVLMIAWAAESLNNVSVYMYDATRMVLSLFNDDGSGSGHDWHNIFSETGLLPHTDFIAYFTRGLSMALFATAIGLAAWWSLKARRREVDRT
jgi:hypothetical protein